MKRKNFNMPTLDDLEIPQASSKKKNRPTKARSLPEVALDLLPGKERQRADAGAEKMSHRQVEIMKPKRSQKKNRPASGRKHGSAGRARKATFSRFKLSVDGRRRLSFMSIIVAVLVIVIIVGSNLLSHNAFAVYLDGRHMGYIPIDVELESETFHNQAVAMLEAGGASVLVDQRVTIRATRASRGDIVPRLNMAGTLSRNFTYRVLLRAIYVNGDFEALVRTDECAEEVARMLKEPFETVNTVHSEFVDRWDVRVETIDMEDANILTPVGAFERLDRPTVYRHAHVVQSNENLGVIATRFNTTSERIAQDNNITLQTIIRPGDVLYVQTTRPLLSVRTVDELESEETIPISTEVRYDPDVPENAPREIIQQGQEGRRQVIHRITRIDGIEVSNETMPGQIITPDVTHIVVEGTGPTQSLFEWRPAS
ncbi:MAG: G5 domain-containing protein [Defluviitaleaceae bacterium]|nr:G5 domain-containing protein [Defluviitaleaceae bacterium]